MVYKTVSLFMAVGLASCADPPAEFLLQVDSDMGLSAYGVDSIALHVFVNNKSVDFDPPVPPFDPADYGYPATLAIVAPDEPDAEVIIDIVGTRSQDFEDGPRTFERTRTIHAEFSTYPIKTSTAFLSYLCAGSGRRRVDDPTTPTIDESTSEDVGGSCVAMDPPRECIDGWCVDPAGTQDLDGANGADCFDTVGCFEGKSKLLIERVGNKEICAWKAANSKIKLSDIADLNVALVTKEVPGVKPEGTCGPDGCYIPLNDTAWVIDDVANTLRLPCAVCTGLNPPATKDSCLYEAEVEGRASFKPPPGKSVEGTLVDVRAASCAPKKTTTLPLCSLKSKVGPGPVTPFAITLAKGQAHPVAIAVRQGVVYWVNGGTFDAMGKYNNDSALVRDEDVNDPIKPELNSRFRDLTIVGDKVLLTEIAAVGTSGAVRCLSVDDLKKAGAPIPVNNPGVISGIGGTVPTIYWTQADGVQKATVSSDCVFTVSDNVLLLDGITQPVDIAMTSNGVCWTGTGGVKCTEFDLLQGSPNLKQASGIATYFDEGKATFAAVADIETGEIFGINITDPKAPLPAFKTVKTDGKPNGIAVDANYVYWTVWENNSGENKSGSVWRMPAHPKDILTPPTPEVIAEGQDHPSAIVVGETAIYWVNEGSTESPTGSIAARSK